LGQKYIISCGQSAEFRETSKYSPADLIRTLFVGCPDFCMKCGRDYGATSAVRRASSPLATAVGSSATEAQQDVSSSTDGAQRAVAEAQQDVSSSTDGAQRAVSPSTASAQRAVSSSSRPAHSLSAPAGTRERGQGGFTAEYHRLARWTNVAFSETNVCSCICAREIE
jgi:hypothetical protein